MGDKIKSFMIVEFIKSRELLKEELLPLIVYVVSKNGLIKVVPLSILYEFDDCLDIKTSSIDSSGGIWALDVFGFRLRKKKVIIPNNIIVEFPLKVEDFWILVKLSLLFRIVI